MQDYQPPIRGFAAIGGRIALAITRSLPEQIQDSEERMMARGVFELASNAFLAYSDDNPEDRKQLLAFVNKFFTDSDFQKGSRAELMLLVSRIANEDVRTIAATLVDEVYTAINILTDENDEDGEQFSIYLREWLRSTIGVQFITAILNVALPGELGQSLSFIVIDAIINLIDGDGPEADPVMAQGLKALLEKRTVQMLPDDRENQKLAA